MSFNAICKNKILTKLSEFTATVIMMAFDFFQQTLVDDAEACRRKMINATALIEGLGGEKVRWTAASKGFEAQIQRLVGDVLLCTGFLSYCGPFNQEFRSLMNKSWKKEMISAKIPYTEVLYIENTR